MAVNLKKTSQKLMAALNNVAGYNLTFGIKQFMGVEGRPINYYVISQAVYSEEKHKYLNNELYSTTSMVRVVLFLRDLWYIYNDWELPTDQPLWNEIREKIHFQEKIDG